MSLLLTFHLALEVTVTLVLSRGALVVHLSVEIDSVGRLWVTLIVLVGAPDDVTVIVPLLAELVVFLVTDILKEPLPV